jgi:DNA-directed RNA polymerase III subunit RPC8
LIQISPQDFEKRSAQAIEDNINTKYADKVIHRIGLCVALYDILQTSEGLIGHGTGIVNVNVDFRMIVFRPFKGEILMGRILSASDMGIRISMGYIQSEDGEWVWVWESAPESLLYFDVNEMVRFRVEAETWTDLSPEKQPAPGEEVEVYRRSPYEITVSV